ncbi:unnamed protein product, partial [Symbiodinium sp. KB8]
MMHQQGLFAMALLCGPIVPLSNGEVTPRADLSVAEGEFVSPNRNPEPRHAAPRALRTDDKVSEGCAWLSITKAKFAVIVLVGMTVMSLFGCMFQPPQGAGGGNSIRLPPRWEPAMETTLPFRTWMQDLMLWTIGTDLAPHQQAVAIISQLGGPARDLARTLTPGELYNGGVINGQALDPVSFLLHGLSSRFAPLDEENRLRAAQDLLSFARRQGESIDALISRFDITRELARREGGGAVAIETAALILLRACGVSSEQFQTLTQPFGLRLPANDAEFSQLCHHLRRMAHIVERHPNNIASGLRQTSQAHFSQASFLAEADTGSSHSAEHWQQGSGGLEYTGVDASGSMDWAFAAAVNGAEGSGTDSETSSDHDEPLPVEDLQGMTNGQERQLTPDPWSQNADPWMQWLQDEARPGGEQAMLMGADLNNEGVLEETHPPPTGDDDPQASEADEFMSPPEHAFPWWPVPDHQPAVSGTGPQHASAYHSNVRLPDGRVGLLIDPGSYGNLVGAQWLEEAATSMRTTPGMTRRSHPLQVGGVGKGEHHLFADDDPLDFEVCERFEYERAAETLLTLVSDWECQGLGAFTFGGKTGITKAPEATFSAVMVGDRVAGPIKVRQHRSELIAGQVHELIEGSLSKLTSDEVTQLIEWDFKLPDVVAKPPASGSGKPDDLITIGESIAGFPTESKIMQKQRRKDDQAQGIVSVPKRKRKIVEQHFDDCGEDLSSLSAPVFQYLASNSSESSEDEGVEIVELRGNEGNSSKLCVRRKLRQHPAADVAQSLAAFCGRVAEAQRAQSRYFLVEQPSPSNLFATPPWPTVCNDPGCYRVIYHQCQAAQPTAERLTKETIELVGNDVELLKPLSNLQCDGIAHGIEMLVRRVFPSVPYWEPKSPGLRGSSLGREAEQQVESRLRRLTNLLKPELKSLLQSTAQASDTVTRLPNADCSGTECDYKVGDTVDWWREPVHKDAPGWRGPGRIIDLSRLEHGRIGVRTNTDQVITCRLQDVRHSLAFASEELSIFFGAEDHIAPAGSHASHAQQYAQAYVDQLKSGSVLTLGHVRTATGQWVETPQTSEHRAVYQACVYVAEVVFQLTNIAAVRLARGARTLTLRDEFVNSLVLWWNAPGSRNISFVHTEASRVSCASLADGHWEGIHLIQFLCVPDCEGWATTARWRVPSLSELPSMPPASTPAASEPDNRSRLSTVPEETEPSEAASLVTWRELCNTFGESIRQSEILPLQEAYEAVVNEEAPGRPQEFTLEQLKIEVTAASMSQAEIPHWSQVGTVSECHWATETQLRELTATCDVEEFVALDADEHGAYVALEAYGDMCKVIDGLDRLPEEGEHVELRMYETHTRKAVIDRSDDLLTDEEARENADLVTQDGQLVMILVKHVDDLKIAGLRHRIEAFIKHVSNTFGKMEVEWSTFTFCGVCHTQSEDGSICLDQIRFLSACKPIVQTSVMSGSPEELLPEDARRQFLSLLMTIAYGLLTRPDVAVFITALQRESHQAKTIHAKRLNVLLKWLQANPRKITFPAMTRPDALLQISDSSYRAKAEDGLSVRGLVSIRVLLKGIEEGHRDMPCHLLDFASKAQRHVTRSTFSSELFAATDATDIGLLHTIAIHELEHGVLSSADAKRAIDGELECSTKLALVVDAKSVSTAVVAATVKVPAEPSLLLHVCWLRALLSKQRLWRLYWADTRSAEHSHLTTADFRSVA